LPFLDLLQKKVFKNPLKKEQALSFVKKGDFTRVFNSIDYSQKFMLDKINEFVKTFELNKKVTPTEISLKDFEKLKIFINEVIGLACLELLDDKGDLKKELVDLLEIDKLPNWNNHEKQKEIKRKLIQSFCTEATIISVTTKLIEHNSQYPDKLDVLEALQRSLIYFFPSNLLDQKQYNDVKKQLDNVIEGSVKQLHKPLVANHFVLNSSKEEDKTENDNLILEKQLDIAYEKFNTLSADIKKMETEKKMFGTTEEKKLETLRKSLNEKLHFITSVLNTENINEIHALMREREYKKRFNVAYLPLKSPRSMKTKLPPPEQAKTRGKYNLLKLAKLGLLQKKGKILSLNDMTVIWDLLQKIKRFTPEERNKYRVLIKKGIVVNAKNLKPFDSKEFISHDKVGFAAYVINPEGEIVFFNHLNKKDLIAHSSLFPGASVFAAGEMKIEEGKLKAITIYSGHYKPKLINIYEVIKFFIEQGVDMSDVKILFKHKPFSHIKLDAVNEVLDLQLPHTYSALEIYNKYKDNESKLKYTYRSIEKKPVLHKITPPKKAEPTTASQNALILKTLLAEEEPRPLTPEEHKFVDKILEEKSGKQASFRLNEEVEKILNEKDNNQVTYTPEDLKKILEESTENENKEQTPKMFQPNETARRILAEKDSSDIKATPEALVKILESSGSSNKENKKGPAKK